VVLGPVGGHEGVQAVGESPSPGRVLVFDVGAPRPERVYHRWARTGVNLADTKKPGDENRVTEPFLCPWATGPEWRRRESNRIPTRAVQSHNSLSIDGLQRTPLRCVTVGVTLMATMMVCGSLGDAVARVRLRKARPFWSNSTPMATRAGQAGRSAS
jgi:hypothetical protein